MDNTQLNCLEIKDSIDKSLFTDKSYQKRTETVTVSFWCMTKELL